MNDPDYSTLNEPNEATLSEAMDRALALSDILGSGGEPGRRWRVPPLAIKVGSRALSGEIVRQPGGINVVRPVEGTPAGVTIDFNRATVFADAMEAAAADPPTITPSGVFAVRESITGIRQYVDLLRELVAKDPHPILESAITTIELGILGLVKVAGRGERSDHD